MCGKKKTSIKISCVDIINQLKSYIIELTLRYQVRLYWQENYQYNMIIWRPEFKYWTRPFFFIALMLLRKDSPSRKIVGQSELFNIGMATYLREGKLRITTNCILLPKFTLFRNRSVEYIYEMPSISFQTFFVQAFEIVVDSWKFTVFLLYILWDDWQFLGFQLQMNSYSRNWNTSY